MTKVISLKGLWGSYSVAIRYHMIAYYDVIEFSDKSAVFHQADKGQWFIYRPQPSYQTTEAYTFCMMTRAPIPTWDRESDTAKQIKSALSQLTIEGANLTGYLIKNQGATIDMASDLTKAQRKWAYHAQKLLTDL